MRTDAVTRRSILVALTLGGWLLHGCAALSPVPMPAPPAGAAAAPTPIPPPTTAQAGATTVVAVAPPAQPCCKQTLPEWLGLTGCCAKIQKVLGAFPALLGIFAPGMANTLAQASSQPPLLPINAPQNLQSSNPAVQTAAQISNDEGQAKQKIAAIQYLATIGCSGCYPDVESALLASLDDCTESVRYAAAKALYDTAGRPCRQCNSKACCSAKIRAKLMSIADGTNVNDCHTESSPRVRRMARLALLNCSTELPDALPEVPLEGPAIAPSPKPAAAGSPTPAPAGSPAIPPSPSTGAPAPSGGPPSTVPRGTHSGTHAEAVATPRVIQVSSRSRDVTVPSAAGGTSSRRAAENWTPTGTQD